MKGNFTTEGLYEATKRKRILPSLTRDINSNESHARHNPREPDRSTALGNIHRILAPEREKLQLKRGMKGIEYNQNGLSLPRLRMPVNSGRLSPSNGIRKGKHHTRTLSCGDQSSPSLGQRPSQLNALNTDLTRFLPQNPLFYGTLWVGDTKGVTDAEPLKTHYDPNSSCSLITLSVVKKLGLKTLIYPPGMHMSMMTKFGMVSPKEYVCVKIEARWLLNYELGTFNISVVSDNFLRETLGVDLLVGKRVIERLQVCGLPKESLCYLGIGTAETFPRPRTSPSIRDTTDLGPGAGAWTAQAHSAYDCLRPVIEPQSPFTQSNSGLASNISTNDVPRSTALTSLSGSIPIQSPMSVVMTPKWHEAQCGPVQDNYISQESVETTPGFCNVQLPVNDHAAKTPVFPPSTDCSSSYDGGQGSLIFNVKAAYAVSPAICHKDTEYLNDLTQAQVYRCDDIQVGTPNFSYQPQSSSTYPNAEVTSASGTQENYISEDSPSIYQGMTDWSFMPGELQDNAQSTSQLNAAASSVPSIRLDTSISSSSGTRFGLSYLDSINNDMGYSHQYDQGAF